MPYLKNPFTTQRFVTWLDYIQTSGSFGYHCFLTKQVYLDVSEAFFPYINLQIQGSICM